MPTSSISEGIVVLDRPFASTGRRLHRANANEFVSLTVQKTVPNNAEQQTAKTDDNVLAQMRLNVGDMEYAMMFDLSAGLQIKSIPISQGDELWAAVSHTNAFLVYGHRSTEP